MVCMYKVDFLLVDGFGGFRNKVGWGGEDLHYYKKFLNKSKLNVFRSITPGLFHLYHSKDCNSIKEINYLHYKDCILIKIINEASHRDFGLHYFNLTDFF